jgi:hypothetical protein
MRRPCEARPSIIRWYEWPIPSLDSQGVQCPYVSWCEITRIHKQQTKRNMKKLGTSLIALGMAGAMFATVSAEANDKVRSSNEQGHQQNARVAFVANSQRQGPTDAEEQSDFGDAAAYEDAHPGDGG